MIERPTDQAAVQRLIGAFPVTAILGSRQCGKTTLAGTLAPNHWFDLENPRAAALMEEPQLAPERLFGLVAINEIQRRPDLFPLLCFLVDTNPGQKYLILGSASRDLIRQSSESLAGRIAFHELGGFRLVRFRDRWRGRGRGNSPHD